MLEKFISEIKKRQEEYPDDKMILQDLYYDAKYFHEVSSNKFKGYCLIFGGIFGLSALLTKPLPILMKSGLFLGTSRVTRQLAYTDNLTNNLLKHWIRQKKFIKRKKKKKMN